MNKTWLLNTEFITPLESGPEGVIEIVIKFRSYPQLRIRNKVNHK